MPPIDEAEFVLKLRRAYLAQIQGDKDALKKVIDERLAALIAELDELEQRIANGGSAGPGNAGGTDTPNSEGVGGHGNTSGPNE